MTKKNNTNYQESIDQSDLEGPKVDRRTSLKLLKAFGATAMTGSLAGCGGGGGGGGDGGGGGGGGDAASTAAESGTGSESMSERRGGTLEAILSTDQIPELDPHYMDNPSEFQIQSNIMSGITKITPEGEITGDLAEDWEIPDDTTYVFTFHENVTWHNGDEFTAEDVKWSLDRLRGLDDSPHQGKVASVESMEVTGDYELTINLSSPTAPFLAFLTRGPGRAGVIVHRSAGTETQSSGSQAQQEYNRMPIGTGPFELTERESGSSLTLERFDDYWETDEDGNQLPYLDGVNIRLLTEGNTIFTSLSSGSAHVVDSVPGSIYQQAQNTESLQTGTAKPGAFKTVDFVSAPPHEHPERASYAGGYPESEVTDKWEEQDLPTTDPRVRKAITMAIDREDLIQKAWFGAASPARQFYNPLMGWMYEEDPPQERGQHYDPERARTLLDEAGYTGDPRMELTFLGPTPSRRPMTVIQQQLSEIGIEVELVIKSPNVAGNEAYQYIHPLFRYDGGSDIDPFMSHWNQRGSPDPTRDYVEEWGLGSWSKGIWANEAFDQKLIESYQTPSFEDRRQILHEAMEIHESIEAGPHEGDQGGPSCAMTVFPLSLKVSTDSVSGLSYPAGLTDLHTAYLTE